jgi:outer membrane lipoprotein-sorting protein
MIKRFVLVAFLGGFAAFAAEEALPKAETILDRYVEVTGGKAAYQKRKTESASGTVELTALGVKGTVTRFAADPDKSYTAMDIAGVGRMEAGSGGGIAWENSAVLGPRVKSGEEKAQAVREDTFNAELNWRKLYPKVETAGVEMVDGEECYKVVLTPAEGKPQTMYFQKQSGLVVKMTTTAVTQMGEVPTEIKMSEYKSFGGVLVPTKTVQKAAGQEFTVTLQTVTVNEAVPAGRFEPPAEVKALLNKAAAPAVKK